MECDRVKKVSQQEKMQAQMPFEMYCKQVRASRRNVW